MLMAADETPKTPETAAPGSPPKPASEPDPASEPKTASEPKPVSQPKSGRGLAFVALVLALLAFGVSAFIAWQGRALLGMPEQVAGDAESRQAESARQAARLTELSARISEQQSALAELRSSVRNSLDDMQELPLRVDQLEAQMEEVPGMARKGRAEYLRAEALYYMRIANAQALLVGDADVAVSALELADEKLRELGDPALTRVRAALADEIAQLRAIPSLDRTGISFRLQAIAERVDEWTFRNDVPARFETAGSHAGDVEGEDMWARVRKVATDAFSRIVSVKKAEGPPTGQLGAAEEALVVEGIRAELQIARLALINGNGTLFRGSLERAAGLIRDFYPADTAAIRSALETLDELAAVEMPGELPDISRALSLLLAETENGNDR